MKKNQLIVVRDRININDRGSDRFYKAILGACRRSNVEIIVSDQLEEMNKNVPTIVMQPCSIETTEYLNVDAYTTAEVCYDIIKSNNSLPVAKNIVIYGNGETIGKPLRNMINDRTDWWCDFIDSKTSDFKKDVLIDDSEVVVIALPFGMKVESEYFDGKIIIDCSDSYAKPDYSFRDIGKLTVEKIIKNVLKY